MASSSEERVLPYTLCTFTVIGIVFNIILLIWHSVKYKSVKDSRYMKYSFGGLNIAYIFTGLAITLLILYSDVGSEDLCKIGGFLTIFSTQESIWMLATSCIVYMLWIRTRIVQMKTQFKTQVGNKCLSSSVSTATSTLSSEYSESYTNKWSVPIFILILIVKCIVLAIVSFLPMTNIAYFDSNTLEYYYLCTPIRLPRNEKGWPYSTLIIILNWIALLVSISAMIWSNKLLWKNLRKLKTSQKWNSNIFQYPYSKDTQKQDLKVEFTMNISFCFNAAFWAFILLLVSINYFSGGTAISQGNIPWVIGFLMSLLIITHPLLVIILQFIVRSKLFERRYCRTGGLEDNFLKDYPNQLENVQKIPSSSLAQENREINQYIVHWKDKAGRMLSGVMKVFHPSARQKWNNELKAIAMIANHSYNVNDHKSSKMAAYPEHHPNIAKYYWQVPENKKYTATICAYTRDILSLQSSVICMNNYIHGNLQQFLKNKIHQLTEVGIHKLTLDIANGLDFIHSKGIVHNNLNTKSVYMASVSEKIGLRAVIGDFENSTEVNRRPVNAEQIHSREQLYAISYNENMKNFPRQTRESPEFSTDIRAFGVLVLEMLISLSEFNHKQKSYTPSLLKTDAISIQSESNSNREKQPIVVEGIQQSGNHCSSAFKVLPSLNSQVAGFEPSIISKCASGSVSHTECCNESREKKHTNHNSQCSCSNRVTDIRAHNDSANKVVCSQNDPHLRLPISKQSSLFGVSQSLSTNQAHNDDVSEYNLEQYLIQNSTSLRVKEDIHIYAEPERVLRIQKRELPAIPIEIEKVVADVVKSAMNNPPPLFPRSRNISEIKHSEPNISPTDRHEERVKPKLKPKPNLLKSIQRGLEQNSIESDADSLYLRSPVDSSNGAETLLGASAGRNLVDKAFSSSSCSDTENCSESLPNSPSKTSSSSKSNSDAANSSDDVYNASQNSCGSFDTIYEDDESQDSMAHSLDSGLGKTLQAHKRYQNITNPKQNGLKSPPLTKRKITTNSSNNGHTRPQYESHEVWKKKRLSGASFNDSVLSGDSGMGSTVYGAHSEVSSSCNNNVLPGSRGTIYQHYANPPLDSTVGVDSYSLLMSYLERNSQKLNDEGSVLESCVDEAVSKSPIKQDTNRDIAIVHHTNSHNNCSTIREDNFDEFYEILPDLMIRKKPCRGHHKQLNDMPCCSGTAKYEPNEQLVDFPSALNNKPPLISKRSTHLHSNSEPVQNYKFCNNPVQGKSSIENNIEGGIKSVDIGKVLVDESTMTGDSLERPKLQHRMFPNIDVENMSAITDISCGQSSVRTLNSQHSKLSNENNCSSYPNHHYTNTNQQYQKSNQSDTDSQISSASRGFTYGNKNGSIDNSSNMNFKRGYYSSSSNTTITSIGNGSNNPNRPNNVPKLGLTAKVFSRQMSNSSAQSTPQPGPLSNVQQSGSMQSIATGRSSVMSAQSGNGRQSARSLPGGTSSINSSILSLLQDSNLLVATHPNGTTSSSSSHVPNAKHQSQQHDQTNKHHHYSSNTSRNHQYNSNHHHHHHHRLSNKNTIRELNVSRASSLHSNATTKSSSSSSVLVASNHPVVKQIINMSSNPDDVVTVLDTLKRKGHLGYTAAQLVPLLRQCWLEEDVPSTQDILVKLGHVLPSAKV